MSLKDIKLDGKYSANMWKVLRRFLESNINQKWSVVYSQICAVAKADTLLGRKLREATLREVDVENVNDRPYPADYFVDGKGLLQKGLQRESWKRRKKKKMQTATIEKILFVDDGLDLWYELCETSDGPAASKYSKKSWHWFRVERKYRTEAVSQHEYINGKYIQTGWKEVVKEDIHKWTCNHKMVAKINKICNRQSKILKLTSYYREGDNRWTGTWHIVATVPGKSRK